MGYQPVLNCIKKVEELKGWERFFFLVDEWQFHALYSCQNRKEPKILLYLLANKLASFSFISAGRRHETPGPETKAFLTRIKANSVGLMFSSVFLFPVPAGAA